MADNQWWNWFRWKRIEQPKVETHTVEEVFEILQDSDLVQEVPEDEISVVLGQGDVVEVNEANMELINGNWLPVASSNVGAIRYILKDRAMEVEFLHNRFYRYYDVEPAFFVAFYHSASKGQFVWEEIRRPDRFHFVRFNFVPGARPS